MKEVQDNKLVPLDKSQLEKKELTPEELENIYYGDLADSQLNCIWY